ncbi:MAG TPA: SDR family oxidoreductase [Polyangiaceae bacterium]|nr:SDR family oxidoreductase [Polyangiaceae bacterium]
MSSRIFRDGLLAGRVALVTGGGSGIGRGIALGLAQQGAKLALVGRTAQKLEAVAEEVRGVGSEAAVHALDVRDFDALQSAVNETAKVFGGLDIVVCSAAGNFIAPAASLSANGFKAGIDIDLLGTFNTCRAAFEQLSVRGGSILSVTATQAWVPTPLQCHAGAAKAGIAKLTQDLALEWGKSKVRVNAIAPGPIDDTEGMRRLAPTESGAREQLTAKMPVGRFGTVQEIADLAVFLCSDAAGFITGTTIVADGGQSLMGATGFLEMMG